MSTSQWKILRLIDLNYRPPEILRERHHDLSILRSKSADLQAQFSTETTSKPGNASDLVIEPGYRTDYSFHESVARESLTGSSRSPGSLLKSNKTVRFRDSLVDTDEMQNRQVLQLHHRVMEEQDESLDRLSASIRNQRELSIQIGDELQDHARLLGDIDNSVDLHQTRLDSAMRKLNRVAQLVKENGTIHSDRTKLDVLIRPKGVWQQSLFLSLF